MAKHKFSRFVSPKGTFGFTHLNTPDDRFAKDPKDAKYKITHALEDTDENRAWCDKVEKAGRAEAKKAGVKLKKNMKSPFNYPEDQDEDDFIEDPETGKSRLPEIYKGAIFYEAKTSYKPAQIDAKKVELPETETAMYGDIGRVKVQLNPYEGFGSGLSLRFNTVQLLEKNNNYQGGGVDDDGFDEEEGYESDGQTDDDEDENEDDDIPF